MMLACVPATFTHGKRTGNRGAAIVSTGALTNDQTFVSGTPLEAGGASRARTQGAWRASHASTRGRRHAPPIASLTDGADHLQLYQAVQLHRVLHRQLLRHRLDEA